MITVMIKIIIMIFDLTIARSFPAGGPRGPHKSLPCTLALQRSMEALGLPLVYRGLVPDVAIRFGIRTMLGGTASAQNSVPPYKRIANKMSYVADLKSRPLAEFTKAANEQHYEVPSAFFEFVMGRYKKYSCGLWPEDGSPCTLDESEAAALALVCERAKLSNTAGLRVLDMGCGWGSFSLYAAERFPLASFTGVSNSATQREFIMAQAAARGIKNLTIVTCDINIFEGEGREFDRVVSIEMMEHVKNYQQLLRRVASWMKPGGLMFVHIFTHAHTPFHYVSPQPSPPSSPFFLPPLSLFAPPLPQLTLFGAGSFILLSRGCFLTPTHSHPPRRTAGWLGSSLAAVKCPVTTCYCTSRTTLRCKTTGV